MDIWIKRNIRDSNDKTPGTHYHSITKSVLVILPTEKANFYSDYNDTINKGINPCLCEIIPTGSNIPLTYTFCLEFNRALFTTKESLTDLHFRIECYIRNTIALIQTLIANYFEIDNNHHIFFTCHLHNKNIFHYTESSIIYHGRIIFPYAKINTSDIMPFYRTVYSQLQLISSKSSMILRYPTINTLNEIIQAQDVRYMDMYGSRFELDDPPLTLSSIYGVLTGDTYTVYQLIDVFQPSYHPMGKQLTDNKQLTECLPVFFSYEYYTQEIHPKEPFMNNESDSPGGSSLGDSTSLRPTRNDLERAKQLIGLFSVRRNAEYWSWYDIGRALHSISTKNDALNVWKWFTSQNDYKGEEDCESEWYAMESQKNPITINTLEFFAFKDDPEAYASICDTNIKRALHLAVTKQTHTYIALAFRECFPFDFVCSNFKESMWYRYTGNRYTQCEVDTIMVHLIQMFVPKIETYRGNLAIRIAQSADAEFKAANNNIITRIDQLLTKLENYGFKEQLCKELKLHYRSENFSSLQDSEPCFFACTNGVIDVRGGKAIFRQGKPEDYITLCGCMYPENYTWNTPIVVETMKYISQVYRDPVLRNSVLMLFASRLRSGNMDKIFPIFTGAGNNSKSIFVRLMCASFGQYAKKMPSSYITEQKRDSGKADPVLSRAQGAKILVLQEPDKNDPIRSGTVKEITGNDSMLVRDLYQRGANIVEIEVSFVPFLIANTIPMIPDCQEAIWERTLIYEHSSKWVDPVKAPKDFNEQFKQGLFPKDRFFDQKVPKMAPAFIWILTQKFEEYYTNGLQVPDEVLQATENFKINNNYFIHYVRDNLKRAERDTGETNIEGQPIIERDMTAFVSLDDMYAKFRPWYKDQQFKDVIPTKVQFKEGMEAAWKTKFEQSADGKYIWLGMVFNVSESLLNSAILF